jgi:hypothetical protein
MILIFPEIEPVDALPSYILLPISDAAATSVGNTPVFSSSG